MKKFVILFVSVVLACSFTACNVGAGEFEPTNQLAKNGRIVSVCGEVFTFEGDGYNVGQDVKVFLNTNGEPTNPWAWWVIDCKPLH